MPPQQRPDVVSLLGICHLAQQTPRPERRLLRRIELAAAVGIALSLSFSGCGRGTPTFGRSGRDTVYVGVAVGLTSPERYVNVFEGVQLALDELNKKRGPKTPALALQRAPSSATSPVAIAAAFRDNPKVIGVVGHTESDATIAAAPVYADRAHDGRDPLVVVSPTASAAAVTRVSTWIFRVCPTVGEQARTLARYVADSLGHRRAGVLYRNDPSGKDFLRAFREEFEKKNGVVTERDPFTEQISEFDAYALRLVKTNAQSVVIAGNSPQERSIIRALHQAGGKQSVIGTNAPLSSDTGDFRGLHYAMLYSPDRATTREGAHFAEAFRARTGKSADHWGALAYDAAMLIGTAVHEKGPDRKAIRDWLAGVGRTRAAFPGVTGLIRFDENRDPVNTTVLVGEVTR